MRLRSRHQSTYVDVLIQQAVDDFEKRLAAIDAMT